MTDRELLELAAKAIGKEVARIDGDASAFNGLFFADHGADDYSWNPLTDDGAALRLAVKLGAHIDIFAYYVNASISLNPALVEVTEDRDRYAATRRAIVLAAAEVGKTQP